jgi:transposase
MNRRIRLQQWAPQDREQWQKLYYRHKAPRLRRRLLALKAMGDGQTLAEVCRTQKVGHKNLVRWLDLDLHGGFKAMLARERRQVPQALSGQPRRVLRYIVLHKTPADYGLDSDQWTARRVQALIQHQWNIPLGLGRTDQLFDQLGLSHQRVHRDDGPVDATQQSAFVVDLKTTECPADGAVVAMDGFALPSVPNTHDVWAPKNTAPKVPSKERNRTRMTGFLTVDWVSGATDVQFRVVLKSE